MVISSCYSRGCCRVFILVSSFVVGLSFIVYWFKPLVEVQKISNASRSNNTQQSATAAVIFLHGLGRTGSSAEAKLKHRLPYIQYVFPSANKMAVTFRGGNIIPAWFNIHGLKPDSQEDKESIETGARLLQELISKLESQGIKRSRIVVGGVSQGGACSLYSSFAIAQEPLAGVVALITWLPLHKTFPEAAKANLKTPVLMCHGQKDDLVGIDFAKLSVQKIKLFNNVVQFEEFPKVAHSVSNDMMKMVENFIAKVLPPIDE